MWLQQKQSVTDRQTDRWKDRGTDRWQVEGWQKKNPYEVLCFTGATKIMNHSYIKEGKQQNSAIYNINDPNYLFQHPIPLKLPVQNTCRWCYEYISRKSIAKTFQFLTIIRGLGWSPKLKLQNLRWFHSVCTYLNLFLLSRCWAGLRHKIHDTANDTRYTER